MYIADLIRTLKGEEIIIHSYMSFIEIEIKTKEKRNIELRKSDLNVQMCTLIKKVGSERLEQVSGRSIVDIDDYEMIEIDETIDDILEMYKEILEDIEEEKRKKEEEKIEGRRLMELLKKACKEAGLSEKSYLYLPDRPELLAKYHVSEEDRYDNFFKYDDKEDKFFFTNKKEENNKKKKSSSSQEYHAFDDEDSDCWWGNNGSGY